jgi:CheY-like chemotaxis protein
LEAPVAQGSETILLIEDETAVRALVRVVLEANGYTVLEAPDGESALRLCAQHAEAIDLVITDLVMPSMSGIEIADRVVALRPGTKVLYMSGFTRDVAVQHAVQAGSAAYLQKPFTPLSLARAARQALDS